MQNQLLKNFHSDVEDSTYHVFIDLELTTAGYKEKGFKPEIIEIGLVVLSQNGALLTSFEAIIKPTRCPKLNARSQNMTGITQSEIDAANCISETYSRIYEILNPISQMANVYHWGGRDVKIFNHELSLNSLDIFQFSKCYDLQKVFRTKYKDSNNHQGLSKALDFLELQRRGNQHRALSDAFAVAEIFKKLLDDKTV